MTEVIRKESAVGTNVKTNTLEEKRVIKHYTDPEAVANGKAIATIAEEAMATEEKAPEAEKDEKTARRDAFKRANEMERRASEKEKLVNQRLAKVEQFEQLMAKAKEDPTSVAKALGMDPSEFYQKLTNKLYSIDEPKKEPVVETDKARQDRLEQEIRNMQQRELQMNAARDKVAFIKESIAPIVEADTEKFQLINGAQGKTPQEAREIREECLSYIFDMMNSHFVNTGGMVNGQPRGEILDASRLAEELENSLMAKAEANLEANLEAIKKVPKLASKFSKVEVSEKKAPTTVSNSIGTKASGGLPTEIKTENDKKIVSRAVLSPKEARLARTKEAVSSLFNK